MKPDVIDDLVEGWESMRAALPRYQKAEDYYEGDSVEVFANPRIELAIRKTGEEYKFGLAAIPVDTLADLLEVLSVHATGPNEAAANESIAAISKANKLQVAIPDLIVMTLEYGDAYLQVDIPDVNDEDEPVGQAAKALHDAGVIVAVQGPKHARMFYDDESERDPVFLIKRWTTRTQAGDRVWRADVYYPSVCERYVTKAGTDPSQSTAWLKYLQDGQSDWELPTPTGDQIPFFHFRTHLPYGKPVHKTVYGCQNAITKMLVTQLTTTDSHGWPQRYALLEAGAELDNANDDPDWSDDTEGFDNGQLQGGTSSAERVGPGTIQRLTGTREVGQWQAADPGVFLDPVNLYIRLMAQLGHTPLHYFDPSGGVPSGESLKVAAAPQTKRADRMKAIFNGSFEEFWDYCLRLKGTPIDAPVELRWADSAPANSADDWNTTLVKQEAGVPVPVTLQEAGYDPETVESWNLPEHPPAPVTPGQVDRAIAADETKANEMHGAPPAQEFLNPTHMQGTGNGAGSGMGNGAGNGMMGKGQPKQPMMAGGSMMTGG